MHSLLATSLLTVTAATAFIVPSFGASASQTAAAGSASDAAAPAPAAVPAAAQPTPTSAPAVSAPPTTAPVSAMPVIAPPAESPLADDAALLLAGTTAKQYTLQQSVDAALSVPLTNLRLELIHDEAFRSLQVARAALDPTVSLNAKARLTDDPNTSDNTDPNDPFVSSDRFRVGVGASYPLINHGSTIDQLHIAQQNLVVADTDVVVRRRDIVSAMIGSYYDLVARQRDVHNRDLTVQALQQQLITSQARYTLGAVTRGDVLSSQSELANATAEQNASQLSLQSSRADFAALVGQDPESVSPVALEPQQAPQLSQSAASVLHQTQANDPQVTALDAQQQIAKQQLALTKARHQIAVTLVTGAGLHQHNNGLTPYYDVGINISLPILDTPSYKASLARDKDAVELRDLDEEQYGLTSKATDLAAILAYQSAIARVEPATESVTSSEEAFRLRQQQYAIGSATQEQVLANLATLVSRRNDLANVLADRDLAVRRLLLNEGTIDIQSVDKFPSDNPAAQPTDTGAAAAAQNGGASTAPSGDAAASTATTPVPAAPASAATAPSAASSTPSPAPAAP